LKAGGFKLWVSWIQLVQPPHRDDGAHRDGYLARLVALGHRAPVEAGRDGLREAEQYEGDAQAGDAADERVLRRQLLRLLQLLGVARLALLFLLVR
jgi:hypothetical protein